jgi:catechol 2,3-dioxygenase-like lactoylglutathione lyase family enzyme
MSTTSLVGLTLHVADVDRSLEFYKRIPGAQVLFHMPGRFAMLRIGQGRLGLLGAKLPTAFHMEIETPDLDAMHRELIQAGIQPDEPPTRRPWGETDFRVTDPDGNMLEFGLEHKK